ncbi:hypothetical protein [Limosilactobacillus pontis]|uniref:Uncharacterized protein n=1 Tax=Limosilactobacillus pontis DSM 8475 TaxID=1423794 RepID=A0A922TL38_9LACO|nr:hypothetical protein [Limosilactobacillus pontis]KRM37606.1 hypothetical protein FD34_GL001225 [Limosilactobacillus pontis DSM 8475]
MNQISKLTLTLVACLGVAGASTVAVNTAPVMPVVQAASSENLALANRNIADYLADCQQYESSDKQFRGFYQHQADHLHQQAYDQGRRQRRTLPAQ